MRVLPRGPAGSSSDGSSHDPTHSVSLFLLFEGRSTRVIVGSRGV